jgi:hypothetical protein
VALAAVMAITKWSIPFPEKGLGPGHWLMKQRTLAAGFIAPCLPIKTTRLPSGGRWLHEIKHDGFRIMRIILLENYPKNCCQFRDVAWARTKQAHPTARSRRIGRLRDQLRVCGRSR